jgi:hypothetical protein
VFDQALVETKLQSVIEVLICVWECADSGEVPHKTYQLVTSLISGRQSGSQHIIKRANC